MSLWGTTWPRSCPDALPWSTATPTTTRSLMKTTGLTEAVCRGQRGDQAGGQPGDRVLEVY